MNVTVPVSLVCALSLASAAMAQESSQDAQQEPAQSSQQQDGQSQDDAQQSQDQPEAMIRATTLLEGNVFAAETPQGEDWNVGEPLLEVPAEWEDIGEIHDLALSPEGDLIGVVVDVGGFLGIGERTVIVPSDDLRAVSVEDDITYITRLSAEQLQELPEVDEDALQ